MEAVRKALRHCIQTHEKTARTQEAEMRLARLSSRELEVLQLVTEGLSSKEIGSRLGLSPRTIEAHRASMFDKLEVGTLAELIKLFVYAVEAGKAEGMTISPLRSSEAPGDAGTADSTAPASSDDTVA
jgi:FixJ family two-component response regulator